MGGRKYLLVAGVVFLFLLNSCSKDSGTGGGGSGGNGNNNPTPQDPTAIFTVSPDVSGVGALFSFDASASYDPQDSTVNLEVRWDFENDGVWDTDFSTVKTITHSYATEGKKTVALQVRDTDGNTASTTRTVHVLSASSPKVSGNITFEKVPITPSGLDVNNPIDVPAKQIVVEAVQSSDLTVVAADSTDNSGNYSIQVPSDNTIFIRAVARFRSGLPSVVVTPPSSGLIYSVTSGNIIVGSTDITGQNFVIPDSTRASGPFNILDVILKAYDLVHASNPSMTLPDLTVYWGEYNSDGTYYESNGLHILGQRSVDSDEFDDHVIAHEYGHFIAANLYRDDSIGGDHSLGDRLDVRVAYSEGFASAFGGMALNDPIYLDSYGNNGANAWGFNLENNSEIDANDGYAGEASVYSILWDLFDSVSDTARTKTDNISYGYGPLNTVWTDSTLNTTADLMYLYPFINTLIDFNSADSVGIKDILGMENVLYPEPAGSTFVEVPPPNTWPYNRTTVPINDTFAAGYGYNKYLANHFYRFTLTAITNVRITTTCTIDIDIYLYRKGALIGQVATVSGNEILAASNLSAGTYVINIQADATTIGNYDITINTF